MTDPRAYLADVLADLAPSTGITGEGGPYHAVLATPDQWHPLVENAGGEFACEADTNEQAEQLARLLNATPAMARALIAVVELHHKTTASFDGGRIVREVCAACHHASQFGVAGQWPCPTVTAITANLVKEGA